MDEPITTDLALALRELRGLANPEDFIVLTGARFELRAAGPDRGEFLVQLEDRARKVSRERCDISPRELESFVRRLFEDDTSWADDFVKTSQPIPKWTLLIAAAFFLYAIYVIAT